ncbi:MAG: glucose-6-phosphate isomerase family protein [Bacillota bacterium]
MLVDVSLQSGLPLKVDTENLQLILTEGVISEEVDIRTLGQMKEVILSENDEEQRRLYYMYRDVHFIADEDRIKNRGLRYDITIIPPGKIGKEYIKTAGHYHPLKPGTDLTYPEIYQIIMGEAHYLLQKKKPSSDEVERVVVVKAKEGDIVYIPPGYGHITINPYQETLVMANWVASEFKSDYGPIMRKRGGAFYEVEENHKPKWLPNIAYQHNLVLEEIDYQESPQFKFNFDKPLYKAIYEEEELLAVLVNPQITK